MKNMKTSRTIPFILLMVIGLSLNVALVGCYYINSDDILKNIFGSEILEFRLFNVKDTVPMFFFSIILLIFFIFNLLIIILSVKLSGIMYQMFPCKILADTIKVDIKELKPESFDSSFFYSATDEQLVIKEKATKLEKYGTLATVLFIAFLGFAALTENGNGQRASIIFFFFSIVGFIYWIYMMRHIQTIIFDRTTGIVTIPNVVGLPSQKIKMEKVFQGNNFAMKSLMGLVNTYTYAGPTIPGYLDYEWWSFYVWYMDRNRPLPQGTLLSTYHEKDFLRRQSEGFPAPKYESSFPISDDRYGYIYGSEEFKTLQRTFRINILTAYKMVHKEIWKKDKSILVENITLIGIYKNCYVFQFHAPKNQKLRLLEDSDIPNDCFFMSSKKSKFYDNYREIE